MPAEDLRKLIYGVPSRSPVGEKEDKIQFLGRPRGLGRSRSWMLIVASDATRGRSSCNYGEVMSSVCVKDKA